MGRPELDLAQVLSNRCADATTDLGPLLDSMRASPVLLVFSDYGGSHKEAKFDVSSFLITSPAGLTDFNARRSRIRAAQLGERRISYKSLGDRVRLQSLGDFLEATDALLGLLVSFAIDKRALHRLTEQAPDSTDERGFGQWASVAFNKLTRVGHLVAMCVEGVRADNQDLVWITDQDDIAPNDAKQADATRLLGHLLSAYCTGPMGHFRFGTTQSDLGDLLIEDLTAVPDLAAGCLNDILTDLHLHPASSSVTRLFAPASPNDKPRTAPLRSWLAGGDEALAKITIAVDEDEHGRCSVRHFDSRVRPPRPVEVRVGPRDLGEPRHNILGVETTSPEP